MHIMMIDDDDNDSKNDKKSVCHSYNNYTNEWLTKPITRTRRSVTSVECLSNT